MKSICAVCGEGPPTSKTVSAVFRINVTGKPGVWACKRHGVDAINNLAKQHGIEEVLERYRHMVTCEPA